jgi:tRNA nucleotidyltransferase (CCA-adding enzyme)
MQIYKVGGAVRDRLLGRTVTETDWVVVGATAEDMLARGFRPVGADFPVFLHPQTGDEYALARTERKSGRGYGGFVFHASPDVTLEQDLQRRDLTINAMAEDDRGRVIDPYGGQRDLEARLLRHVSPAFAEDPLRVLRVARFAARYAPLGFRIAPPTLELMKQLATSGEMQALTPERSWKEIARALMEPRPDVFIQVLRDCGALRAIMPELDETFDTAAPIRNGEHRLQVLRQCAAHEQPLTIRWANLLRGLAPTRIEAVNSRCKAPRDCQELATLVGEYGERGHRARDLGAVELSELLQRFDVYRRPQRFEEFICANATDAETSGCHDRSAAEFLRGAARAARAVQAGPLLEQGFRGAELGEAMKQQRIEALERYKQQQATGAG